MTGQTDLKGRSGWRVERSISYRGKYSSHRGTFCVSACVYVHALVPNHVVSAMQQTLCCVMQTKNSSSLKTGMFSGRLSHWHPLMPIPETGVGPEPRTKLIPDKPRSSVYQKNYGGVNDLLTYIYNFSQYFKTPPSHSVLPCAQFIVARPVPKPYKAMPALLEVALRWYLVPLHRHGVTPAPFPLPGSEPSHRGWQQAAGRQLPHMCPHFSARRVPRRAGFFPMAKVTI